MTLTRDSDITVILIYFMVKIYKIYYILKIILIIFIEFIQVYLFFQKYQLNFILLQLYLYIIFV